IGDPDTFIRARRSTRLPSVLTVSEVRAVLSRLNGRSWLIGSLLYGSGLRLMECLRLRVNDVDFEQRSNTVRSGKGGRDRITMLPDSLNAALALHLESVRRLHDRDLADGFGKTHLPFALASKYPAAASSWIWQYLFPARHRTVAGNGVVHR